MNEPQPSDVRFQTHADIKALLAARGLRPKHRYGQNFLVDPAKLDAIVAAAAIVPGDVVLEVGPGTGVLAQRLLHHGARLVAVEIDHDLEPILRETLAPWASQLTLVIGDVLAGKHHLNPKVMEAVDQHTGGSFKLIANLPYNVASPLIANLAIDYPRLSMAIVMVQREVADRLTAGPGGKDYGQLGVIVQAMCQVQRVATLPPGCFWPQPKVDSAVVRLLRRDVPLTTDPHRLSKALLMLFSKRRKQLGAIVGRTTPLPPGVDPTARPETLSVEQLVELAQKIV